MNKKVKVDEIVIDGTTYVPRDSVSKLAETRDGLPYVMVRTYSAGVHCGYLKERNGKELTLLDSIRIWKWSGASALSQLAMEGTINPGGCKFEMSIVTSLVLTEAIEIIEMTEKAKTSIQNTPSWKS